MRILKYAILLAALFTATTAVTSCGDDDENTEVVAPKYDKAQATVYVAIYENQLQYVQQKVILGINHQYKTIEWADMKEVAADAVPAALADIGRQAEEKAAATTESGKVRYFAYTDPTVYAEAAGSASLVLSMMQGEPDEDEVEERFNLLVAGMVSVKLTDSASSATCVASSKIDELETFTDIDIYFEELGDAAKYLDGMQTFAVNF